MPLESPYINIERTYEVEEGRVVAVIKLRSSVIDDYLTGALSELSLTLDKNCCGKGSEEQITAGDITDNYIEKRLPASGVYSFTLEAKYESGHFVKASKCVFVDINVLCRIIDKLNVCECTDVHLLYYIIDKGHLCDCSCQYLCNLYQRLLDELDRSCEEQSCLECDEQSSK